MADNLKLPGAAPFRAFIRQIASQCTEILLAGILLLALGLRLWGLDFGLPNLYHPDEDALVMPALSILKTGDLQPIRMDYGNLHVYTLAAVSVPVYLNDARHGLITDPAELPLFERGSYPAQYAFPAYFVAARAFSALLGLAIVLLVYLLAGRLGSRRQALLAAALAAVTPALVTHAHFATTDTALTFWCVLALYLLLRVYDRWEEDGWAAYAGAGFVCGLAMATKGNGLILAGPLLLVPLLRVRRLEDGLRWRVLCGPLAMVAGFLVGTPYALLALPEFLHWTGYVLHLYQAPGVDPAGASWQWYLNHLLRGPNAPLFLVGLLGLILSWRTWGRRGWLVNSFVLLMWLAIVTQVRREGRMWLPTAPLFAIWAALALDSVTGWLRRRLPAGWLPRASSLLFLLILLPLLAGSVRVDLALQSEDVRTQAQHWLEANLPAGTPLAVDYFPPNLDPAVWPVTRQFHIYDQDVAWYQARGIRYVILSQAISDPAKLGAADLAAYNDLVNQSCLVYTFTGSFLSVTKMQMWLYQLPPCP